MTINDQILYYINYNTMLIEKQLKYQLYRNFHKYEYLAGEDILPSNQ